MADRRPLTIRDLQVNENGELFIKVVTTLGTMRKRPASFSDLRIDENGQLLVVMESIPAEGVQSVSGDLVDNTDPDNPVINTPTASQVGADPAGSAATVQDNLDSYQTTNDAAVATKLTATQGATQADSVATDTPGIVADFNTLLANLRTAGIIAT